MLLSVPLGRIADRFGRKMVFFSGYLVLGLIYFLLLFSAGTGLIWCLVCLFLFGLYYAATEGVLTAMVSALIPAEYRTSGLALLGTSINLGKLVSSLLFGWLWQTWGTQTALSVVAIGLVVALLVGSIVLGVSRNARLA